MSDNPFSEDNPYASSKEITPEPFGKDRSMAVRQLSGTKTGLQLIYYGIVAILLAIVLMIVSMIASFAAGADAILAVVGMVVLAAIVIGGLMAFVGQCFCLSVPAASGAKGFVIAAVVLQVVNFLSGVAVGVLAVVGFDPAAGRIVMPMQLFNGIAGLVSFFCFLIFIKRVAAFIDRPDQQEYAGKVIGVFGAIVGLYVVMVVVMLVMAFGAGQGPPGAGMTGVGMASGCVGLVILVLGIAGLCMYTTLLRNMAAAIDDRMRGRE